jgi:hypothetical protein
VFFLVEVAVVSRVQLELAGAAREGARVAATTPDPARAIAAVRRALGSRAQDARIAVHRPHVVGQPAEVRIALEVSIGLPFGGGFGVPLEARAVMRVER